MRGNTLYDLTIRAYIIGNKIATPDDPAQVRRGAERAARNALKSGIFYGMIGAAAGLVLGALQHRLLRQMLPREGQLRRGWLLPVKFLLWLAAILGGALLDPVFAVALALTASGYYVVRAAMLFFRSR